MNNLLHEQFLQTERENLFGYSVWKIGKYYSPPKTNSGLGRTPWFDVKGGIALQLLNHYLQLSDALLIERINTDWSMQLFCGILLKPESV